MNIKVLKKVNKKMKNLDQVILENKKIVLRAGFDVVIKNGQVIEDERIASSLITFEKIFEKNPALLVVVSHLGRPEGERKEEFSNKPVADRLARLSGRNVILIEDIEELERLTNSTEVAGQAIYILENIRFWSEEKKADEFLAKKIGKMFDVYINDAFSVSHRDHMSISRLPKYTTEKCMGELFREEYENLSQVRDEVKAPSVAIIGGAKIETKLPVIKNLERIYDRVLVGGKIANEAIDQQIHFSEKVFLPVDFSPLENPSERLDIGPKTIELYTAEIKKAKTIVWNGPVGKFEEEMASYGSRAIAQAVGANKEAFQVIGGGETLQLVDTFDDFSHFDYVSMSGGAMLEFLEGKELPGLKALS